MKTIQTPTLRCLNLIPQVILNQLCNDRCLVQFRTPCSVSWSHLPVLRGWAVPRPCLWMWGHLQWHCLPYAFNWKLFSHTLSAGKGRWWTSILSSTSALDKDKWPSRSAHGFRLITLEAWTTSLLAFRWLASSL